MNVEPKNHPIKKNMFQPSIFGFHGNFPGRSVLHHNDGHFGQDYLNEVN